MIVFKKLLSLTGVLILVYTLTSCTYGKTEFRNFRKNNSNHLSKLRLNGLYFYESERSGQKRIHPIFLYGDGSVYSAGIHFDAIPVNDSENNVHYENTLEQTFDKMVEFYNNRRDHESRRSSSWGIYRVTEDSLHIRYFTQLPSAHIGLCDSDNIIINDTTFVQLRHRCFQNIEIYETFEKRQYKFYEYPFKPDSTYNWTRDL